MVGLLVIHDHFRGRKHRNIVSLKKAKLAAQMLILELCWHRLEKFERERERNRFRGKGDEDGRMDREKVWKGKRRDGEGEGERERERL